MKNSQQEGRKFDKDKPRPSLIPIEALDEVLKVLEHGAQKYGEYNWQEVEAERYLDAALRHVLQISGEVQKNGDLFPKDKDSGISEWAHVAANALFMLWKEKNQ